MIGVKHKCHFLIQSEALLYQNQWWLTQPLMNDLSQLQVFAWNCDWRTRLSGLFIIGQSDNFETLLTINDWIHYY